VRKQTTERENNIQTVTKDSHCVKNLDKETKDIHGDEKTQIQFGRILLQ
jgi:hypothetical protein